VILSVIIVYLAATAATAQERQYCKKGKKVREVPKNNSIGRTGNWKGVAAVAAVRENIMTIKISYHWISKH
jgi:hypothetical protein